MQDLNNDTPTKNTDTLCIHLVSEKAIPLYLGAINIGASKHIFLYTQENKEIAIRLSPGERGSKTLVASRSFTTDRGFFSLA